MKKVLFIDRDGTIIKEPPVDFQVDSFNKLSFIPGVIKNLSFITNNLDYELSMVTNQDGLGTESFPEETFWGPHNLMLDVLENEGVKFDDIFIDKSFAEEDLPTRKPGVGMLTKYFSNEYDMSSSYVIGDRLTDIKLAANLSCKAIFFKDYNQGTAMIEAEDNENGNDNLKRSTALITDDWDKITEYLFAGERIAQIERKSNETDIVVKVNLDGTGKSNISTGLGFFDHMLDQIAKHSGIDLFIETKGDIEVDEHHTIEDTGIVLGEALLKTLGNKRGIERYGYSLPMDDCLCSVVLDFGGRPWIVWDVDFKREMVGDVPTEMIFHFFKSLSDAAKMNLNVKAEGDNDHHKIEGIFKAFPLSIKIAIKSDIYKYALPSSKGIL